MKVNMYLIRSKGGEYSHGLMDEGMRDSGNEVSSMVRVNLQMMLVR